MNGPSAAQVVARVVGLLLRPARTWEAIDDEPVEARALLARYVAPLAAIGAVSKVAGALIFGVGIANFGIHVSPLGLVLGALAAWGLTVALVYGLAAFVDVTAPAFGGVRGRGQALKLIAYGGTASWVGGFAEFYPNLGIPVGILAGLYSLYALYLGLPKLMRIPTERRLTAFAALLIAIVLALMLRGSLSAKATELGGPLSAAYAPR